MRRRGCRSCGKRSYFPSRGAVCTTDRDPPRIRRSPSSTAWTSAREWRSHFAEYTEHPFLGSRKIVRMLAGEGLAAGRHTVRRYRREMGLETLFPKPNSSKPSDNPEHRVFPYLLRGLVINRANQVWGQAERSSCRVDITYIRLVGGWAYLVAFLDWYSRFVVAWESRWKLVSTASDTLEMGFVIACSSLALGRAVPGIVNSDQGGHYSKIGRQFVRHQPPVHRAATGGGSQGFHGRPGPVRQKLRFA